MEYPGGVGLERELRDAKRSATASKERDHVILKLGIFPTCILRQRQENLTCKFAPARDNRQQCFGQAKGELWRKP